MQNQVDVIEIEGPLVDGKLLQEGQNGPLVSAPHTAASVKAIPFRPRPIRFYNYAEAPARPGKAIGKAHGIRFKRVVPFDEFHRKLIDGGLVKACGEPKPAPAHISLAMRRGVNDAKAKLPEVEKRIPELEAKAKKAAAELGVEQKKGKKADEEKIADLGAASNVAMRRHMGHVREAEAYRKIIADMAKLEETL